MEPGETAAIAADLVQYGEPVGSVQGRLVLDLLAFSGAETVLGVGVLFGAAYVRGLTGFGFSAVLVAGLSFFVDPAQAVALAVLFEITASVIQTPGVWKDIAWGPCGALLAAAFIGNPVGVWVLSTTDADTLRVVVFLALLTLAVGLLLGWSSNIAPTLGVFFAVGLIAGVVNGATALAGLVIVLGMSFMSVAPIELRATLIAYFFGSDLMALGWLAARGAVNSTELWRLMLGLPVLVVGVLVGSRTFRNISPERFRRVVLWLLVGLAVAGLARTAVA